MLNQYRQPSVARVQLNSVNNLLVEYSDNTCIVLDQSAKQMLGFHGGTQKLIQVQWLQDTECFVCLSEQGLGVWQRENLKEGYRWIYRIQQLEGKALSFTLLQPAIVLIAFHDGSVRKYCLQSFAFISTEQVLPKKHGLQLKAVCMSSDESYICTLQNGSVHLIRDLPELGHRLLCSLYEASDELLQYPQVKVDLKKPLNPNGWNSDQAKLLPVHQSWEVKQHLKN
jgi:hypothetical protein